MFDIYNEVVTALKSCLAKDDMPFEEKKYYIEKMVEIAKMAESKDTENKGIQLENDFIRYIGCLYSCWYRGKYS